MIVANKARGIKAGLICFTAFMVVWLFPIFASLFVAPEALDARVLIQFIVGTGIIICISAFFGFSFATKSIVLKIISSLFVLAIPAYWVSPILFNHFP